MLSCSPRAAAPSKRPLGAVLISAVLALAALLAPLGAAAESATDPAKPLVVIFDQSTLLRLPRPAAEIIIGNPAIADVSIQAGNLLVVTGKSFGTTNIIVLDAERALILEQIVKVGRQRHGVVNLVRGSQRQSYSCTPECNPALIVGDEAGYFNHIQATTTGKMSLSERAADSGNSGTAQ